VGVVGKLCAWCSAVHAIIILMLTMQSLGWSGEADARIST